ncbi:MAG: hypothetical protein KDC87_11270 [Planctomycetes bacterium]|nr:hypothetical protein [Planctomycetota bacterium]MCB9870569.1 hypothetical protein [Planctomycetota bacterium]
MPLLRTACLALLVAVLLSSRDEWCGSTALARADANAPFDDPDGDMVPTCIEELMQTDPNRADTDADGIDDFEEILTFTSHVPCSAPAPVDQGMRVLVTSTPNACGQPVVYLHLLLRFVNLKLNEVKFHDLYVDLEGKQYSLVRLLGYGGQMLSRHRERDGSSFLISIPLASQTDLMRILPCTVGAKAALGGKLVNKGCYLMQVGEDIGALMPFGDGSLALQPVSSLVLTQDGNPYYRGGGRVCETKLMEVGSSSRGTLCEVISAECKPAAGLRCSVTCPKKEGSMVTIPDGLQTITGG